MANIWCEVLGIKVPSLERVKDHREANTYSPLLTPSVASPFFEACL